MTNTFKIKKPSDIKWIEQNPYVDNTGIWIPAEPYIEEGSAGLYKLLLSKELFVEAYDRWIKGAENE